MSYDSVHHFPFAFFAFAIASRGQKSDLKIRQLHGIFDLGGKKYSQRQPTRQMKVEIKKLFCHSLFLVVSRLFKHFFSAVA